MLLQLSIAVNVRTMVYACGQLPAVVVSSTLISTSGSQESAAEYSPILGTSSSQLTVTFSGSEVKYGLVVSTIVITVVAVVELPQWSVAVHV
ncbi:MAG: hypothetical protein ACKOSR_04740 [Flavobacteriales bacterium]